MPIVLPFLLLLIIVFPFTELYLFFQWIETAPIIALLYMLATMGLGTACIKFAKVGFSEFFRHARTDAVGARAVLLFGKLWIIGVLLFFPGYLTDGLAVIIWLLSFAVKPKSPPPEKRVVEVESRFVDEPDNRDERS